MSVINQNLGTTTEKGLHFDVKFTYVRGTISEIR